MPPRLPTKKQFSFWSTGDQLTRYTNDTGRPGPGGGTRTLTSAGPAVAEAAAAHAPAHPVRPWLDRRRIMAAYTVFAGYAVIDAVFSAGEDQVWAIWAACGYAVTLLRLWRWPGLRVRTAAVLVSVALAVVAPLLWLSVAYPLEDGMHVIERSATLLLHHGTPYLGGGRGCGGGERAGPAARPGAARVVRVPRQLVPRRPERELLPCRQSRRHERSEQTYTASPGRGGYARTAAALTSEPEHGRLDPAHAPPGENGGVGLDELRPHFPGL